MTLSDRSEIDAVEEVRKLSDRLSSTISDADQEENYKLLHHVLECNNGYAPPIPRIGMTVRRYLPQRSLSPPSRGLRSATPPLFAGQPLLHASPKHMLASSQTSFVTQKMPHPHLASDENSGNDISTCLDDFRRPICDPAINAEKSKYENSLHTTSRIGTDPMRDEMATLIPPSPPRKASNLFGNGGKELLGLELSIEEFGEREGGEDREEAEKLFFDDVVWQVNDAYVRGHKVPCVMFQPKEIAKNVQINNMDRSKGMLDFFILDDAKHKGYWVLTDEVGERHIVSYFSKGPFYKEWLGAESQFSDDIIAYPLSKAFRSQKQRRIPIRRDGFSHAQRAEDPNTDVEAKDRKQWYNPEYIDNSTGHALRKRSLTQERPYLVDKKIHEAARKGTVKRESDVESDLEHERERLRKKARKGFRTPPDSRRTSGASQRPFKSRHSISTPRSILTMRTPEPSVLDELVKTNTTLQARIPGDDIPTPVYLRNCSSAADLWDRVVAAWAFELGGKKVRYLTVKFPWLHSRPATRFRPELEYAYEGMLEIIRKAPCWKMKGDQTCDVDIMLVTE